MNLEHTESLICGDRAAFGPFIGPAGIKGRLTVKSLLLVGPEHPLLEAVDAFILIVRLGNDSFELSFLPSGAVEKSRPGRTGNARHLQFRSSNSPDRLPSMLESLGCLPVNQRNSGKRSASTWNHLCIHSSWWDRSSGQSKPIFDETW
jgi:hypothetical protein